MLNLPFNLILMPSNEWERQVQSRIHRSLREFIEQVFYSRDGFEWEIRPGMSEMKMEEIVRQLSSKKRFRKRKKTEVKK
ncbi:MAG TPA: hypothetical protein VJ044_06610 [Candidatus Hodarchaeales archaeon]|nr:hypothetical protein [Candidatus Hodarchaeales archaeon]